jgi:hypothetical protein
MFCVSFVYSLAALQANFEDPFLEPPTTVAKLWKSIGARVDAYYCWHTNDHARNKESSIAQLLGISQLEMVLILEKCCEILDKETKRIFQEEGVSTRATSSSSPQRRKRAKNIAK